MDMTIALMLGVLLGVTMIGSIAFMIVKMRVGKSIQGDKFKETVYDLSRQTTGARQKFMVMYAESLTLIELREVISTVNYVINGKETRERKQNSIDSKTPNRDRTNRNAGQQNRNPKTGDGPGYYGPYKPGGKNVLGPDDNL